MALVFALGAESTTRRIDLEPERPALYLTPWLKIINSNPACDNRANFLI